MNAQNDAPTISNIGDISFNEDTQSALITFSIGDVDTPLDQLVITRASSSPGVIDVSDIIIGGSGANRTVRLNSVPNASGSSFITLTVQDGQGGEDEVTFRATVNPVNDAPTISAIGTQTVNEDSGIRRVNFTIDDVETANGSLNVSVVSANGSLIPLSLIHI